MPCNAGQELLLAVPMSFQKFLQLFHQKIVGDFALAHMALPRNLGQHLAGQSFQAQEFIAPAGFGLATAANSPSTVRVHIPLCSHASMQLVASAALYQTWTGVPLRQNSPWISACSGRSLPPARFISPSNA